MEWLDIMRETFDLRSSCAFVAWTERRGREFERFVDFLPPRDWISSDLSSSLTAGSIASLVAPSTPGILPLLGSGVMTIFLITLGESGRIWGGSVS